MAEWWLQANVSACFNGHVLCTPPHLAGTVHDCVVREEDEQVLCTPASLVGSVS